MTHSLSWRSACIFEMNVTLVQSIEFLNEVFVFALVEKAINFYFPFELNVRMKAWKKYCRQKVHRSSQIFLFDLLHKIYFYFPPTTTKNSKSKLMNRFYLIFIAFSFLLRWVNNDYCRVDVCWKSQGRERNYKVALKTILFRLIRLDERWMKIFGVCLPLEIEE